MMNQQNSILIPMSFCRKLWVLVLMNYLYADVHALFDIAGRPGAFEPLPGASDGFSGLHGNTHRHDPGVSTVSV